MADEQGEPRGPDLTRGIAASDLGDGAMLLGHIGDQAVLLARRGAELYADRRHVHPLQRALG